MSLNILFIRILTIFTVLSTFLNPVCAQQENNTTASVWAWELKGGSRKVYLIGELHSFTDSANRYLRIEHKLGNAIKNAVSEIWIEQDQQTEDTTLPIIQMEEQMSSTTWAQMDAEVKAAFLSFSIQNLFERKSSHINFMLSAQSSHPASLYGHLISLGSLKRAVQSNFDHIVFPGFSETLKEKNNDALAVNIFNIETKTVIAESWRKNCGYVESDALIRSAINSFKQSREPIYYTNVQADFLAKESDLDSLYKTHMQSDIGFIVSKCVIVPRNYLWMPKILEKLKTDGPPVAFLVGIGHLWGDEGLISLLSKQGYKDIKRVYSVE